LSNTSQEVEERVREMAEAGFELVSVTAQGEKVSGMTMEVSLEAPGGTVLSAKTIDSLPAGTYPFLILHGENFARLAEPREKHRTVSGVGSADAAGQLTLVRDGNGKLVRVDYTMESGTYVHDKNWPT
jgi:hypothetical protein